VVSRRQSSRLRAAPEPCPASVASLTFSIVARAGDAYGVAVASKFIAVGSVVPAPGSASVPSPRGPRPRCRARRTVFALLAGATVRLTYTGSECRDGADAEVDEDSTRVVITVRESVQAMSCTDVGVLYDVEVRLNAPLADRELVDGACQMSEHANYAECGPNTSTIPAAPILTTPPRTVIGVEDVLRLDRLLLAQQENLRPKYFGPILPQGFDNCPQLSTGLRRHPTLNGGTARFAACPQALRLSRETGDRPIP